MRKTFVQSGSVKVFVIVGVILAALALMALYFVGRNFYADQVPPMVVPESIVEQNDADISDEAQNGPAIDDEGTASDSEGSQTSDSGDQSAQSNTTSGEAAGSSPVSSDNLPQTGPSDDMATALALVALTVSTASYVGSVRHLRSS